MNDEVKLATSDPFPRHDRMIGSAVDRQNTLGSDHIACLETLVLQNFLNRCIIAVADQFCLKDHAERAVADDLTVRIGQLMWLSRLALVGHHFDNLGGI